MRRRNPVKLMGRQRRLRYAGRKSLAIALIGLVAGGMVLADRMGLFGRPGRGGQDDLARYDGRTFRVVHVVDGDTLDVDEPDGPHRRTRIRLMGVDTPETVKPDTPVQRFGPEASAFAKQAALDRDVRLELDPREVRDKYGRLLAYVYLPDGRMLNRTLVQEGYGFADPRFPHRYDREFARLQNEAKAAGRGLWKDERQQDLPEYLQGRVKLPAR
jgi:micrococcal nuclease